MNKIEAVYEQVLSLVGEVPFGNSDYQNRSTIINGELTPERAYRHASLRILNRLDALRECSYGQRKASIEVKILQRDLDAEPDVLKRELIALEIEKKQSGSAYIAKLARDAKQEIASLWPIIQSMGKLTKEQFEKAEAGHYERKIGKQIPEETDLFTSIVSNHLQRIDVDIVKMLDHKDADIT